MTTKVYETRSFSSYINLTHFPLIFLSFSNESLPTKGFHQWWTTEKCMLMIKDRREEKNEKPFQVGRNIKLKETFYMKGWGGEKKSRLKI